ncbi:unnamed protein product [Lactuca virosa]|uniref:Protein kinase domain-containing protein n=1 Tax=Lactuca virosa TaxID=75947 RepID=A0AAU9N9P3_9ASTR|nr:unnamed protein product [Lactuca virosa]
MHIDRRSNVPSFSQKPSNLRVFTFPELKSATNGFSRSAKIGEGGCGCVYIGVIKSDQDPTKKLRVAVKESYTKGDPESVYSTLKWISVIDLERP